MKIEVRTNFWKLINFDQFFVDIASERPDTDPDAAGSSYFVEYYAA